MGYFDYLDDKGKATANQDKFSQYKSYDIFVKSGLYTWLASIFITLVSIVLMFVCWPIGKSVFLDLILIFAIIHALVAMIL
jgi:DNA modification methylase